LQSRYLHTTAQTQNKHTETSMPGVEFELTTPMLERTKTFHEAVP
jgi:hypothetical protein